MPQRRCAQPGPLAGFSDAPNQGSVVQALAQMMRHKQAVFFAQDLEAIRDHICRLLNSRKTQNSSAPDYGFELHPEQLRDVLAALPQSLDIVEQALIATLAAHEKRLCHWRLRGRSKLVDHILTVGLSSQVRHDALQVVHLDCVFAPHRRVEARLWI